MNVHYQLGNFFVIFPLFQVRTLNYQLKVESLNLLIMPQKAVLREDMAYSSNEDENNMPRLPESVEIGHFRPYSEMEKELAVQLCYDDIITLH